MKSVDLAMPLLDFTKPKKLRSTVEHNAMHSSDSGVEGTYVPNMSDEDNARWKARHLNKGKVNARIEIRKAFGGAQVLINISRDEHNLDRIGVAFSTNGRILCTLAEWSEIDKVIAEARAILEETRASTA